MRIAILGGVRTPFVKAGTVFAKMTFRELGVHVVDAALERVGIAPEAVDTLLFSTVLLDPRTPNWAREIGLASRLPKTVYAESVSNNCISGLVAAATLADRIDQGRVRVGLAGGAESMSRPTLTLKPAAEQLFTSLSRARSFGERLSIAAGIRPNLLIPVAPSVKEPSTGLSMGQHMEQTAQALSISREAQDQFAYESHRKAAAATAILAEEIAPLGTVERDGIVRGDTTVEKLVRLKPAFDHSPRGTLTAGNSTALTDGAAAIVLSSIQRAEELRIEPTAYLIDYELSAIDPSAGLLMAPAYAVPRLLERNQLTFDDIDIFEIHEAFAAQVLANMEAWAGNWQSPKVGRIPAAKLNIHGGSLALGHPFAATGGRLILTAARELKRSGKKRALISACAAGGMGCAMLISR